MEIEILEVTQVAFVVKDLEDGMKRFVSKYRTMGCLLIRTPETLGDDLPGENTTIR